jgi:hypothetical protein
MLGGRRWPIWAVLVLAAGAFSLYLLIPPRRYSPPDLEIVGRPTRYAPGDDLPMAVAADLPKEAVTSYSPKDAPIKIPAPMKPRRTARDYPDLPDLQRSKLVKRGKKTPEERELRYRYRLGEGWEYYEVPRPLHEFYSNKWNAFHLAREATGEAATAASGKAGFRITHIDEGSLLEEIGILPGDILISVNGRPVRGPADGRRLYGELKHQSRFWVVVDRKGETVNLYYKVR